jgi:hypothetical protein
MVVVLVGGGHHKVEADPLVVNEARQENDSPVTSACPDSSYNYANTRRTIEENSDEKTKAGQIDLNIHESILFTRLSLALLHRGVLTLLVLSLHTRSRFRRTDTHTHTTPLTTQLD